MRKIGFSYDREEPVTKNTAAHLDKDRLDKAMERMKQIYALMDMASDSLTENNKDDANGLFGLASDMMKRAQEDLSDSKAKGETV